MKKSNFFTTPFLDACESELIVQHGIIMGVEAFGSALGTTQSEREVAKIFYNRILFLLYQGGRISQIKFIESSYMVGDWQKLHDTSLD